MLHFFRILEFFNADPNEYSVIFTSGSTAALKLVGECFQFTENGAFYYLTDMHTSVLGLREIVSTNKIVPLSRTQLYRESFKENSGKSLFTFPAQCNFNGHKYPLDVISALHKNESNYILLDAAAFASTNYLDLTRYKPDYACVSFYKIFG
jgi:molybdenum cofactor sulfurtransferase